MINIERVISKTPMVIADYFTEDGLLKQVGLVKEYWNRIVVKELTDNALDAIEPLQDKKVFMDVTSGSLGIYDNGTGIKKETVEDIYDFENYVSQNRNYITASRGKQGNGLKTIISICYIQGYRLLWHTAEGIILEANIDSEQLRYGRLEVSFVEIGVTDKRGIEIIGIGAVENFLYDYFIGYSKCNPDVSFYLNYFGEKIENLAKMEGIDKSKNISIAYYDYDSYQNFIIHTQDGNTTYKQFLDNVFGTRMKNKSNIKSKIKDIDFKSDEFIKDFLMLKEDQQTKKYTLLKKQLIGLENILTTTVEIVDNEAPKGMNDKVIPCIVEFSVNDKMKNFDGTMRQINNCYSRYCDKELCIAYATDYENRYGYEHKIVQTRKNKEEADKNRRLAAIYNRICEGHEYPIEVVREVQKYIRNKNQYLQKLIDEKKAQSYMAFSEKEWVARLESQLRDESVFLQAKLESDCEFESNIWGEPNPLDIFIEEAV